LKLRQKKDDDAKLKLLDNKEVAEVKNVGEQVNAKNKIIDTNPANGIDSKHIQNK